jgi:6-phosphogluconolactonase
MRIQVHSDADAAATAGAKFIAAKAREAVAARGRFVMAVSGGRVPWQMFRILVRETMPWKNVHITQVDERVAPAGDQDRNLTHLRESLLSQVPLPPAQAHAMPVEENDLEAAAVSYESLLRQIAGSPPVLDLVHLGLGPDGHTASLVPGDPVLEVTDRDVAVSGVYQKRRRMTLTYPILNRARCILWLVNGSEKSEILKRLASGDGSSPAGRIRRDTAVVLADCAAAGNTSAIETKGISCA